MAVCIKCYTDVGCACNLDDDYRSKTYGMCWGCRNTYNATTSSTTSTSTTINPNLIKAIQFRP